VPRAGLSTDVVVAEAARVADEIGFDRLTLAAVAERFGVAVPSLYKHVDGLPELRRAISVLALCELADEVAGALDGRDRAEALSAMADAYRRYARAHPGRYATTLRAPDPADEAVTAAARRVLELVYGVLAGYGLAGDDAVDATRTVRAALHGFVALEAAGGFGMPQDVDRSFARMVDALDASLSRWTTRSAATGTD
jgi:AcrR family transcriptional regulator